MLEKVNVPIIYLIRVLSSCQTTEQLDNAYTWAKGVLIMRMEKTIFSRLLEYFLGDIDAVYREKLAELSPGSPDLE